MTPEDNDDFESAARESSRNSLAGELLGLLKTNKKWWMLPIITVLLLVGVLLLLSGTGLAPFIYTLF